MIYDLIVCTDLEGGISKNGKIPWKIEEDYNFFRDTITNKLDNLPNVIIMGKNTYNQMNLVKSHVNIIISSTIETIDTCEIVFFFKSIQECIEFLKNKNNPNLPKYNKIFVCGGTKIYDYFLSNDTYDVRLYWTFLDKSYNCDNKINVEKLMKYSNNQIVDDFTCADILNNQIVGVRFMRPRCLTQNQDEQKYIQVMNYIITTGKYTKCRNGYTYSKFGEILKFNLERFPLLTTKKMFFKGIFEELMYFLKGDTNTKHLSDKNVKIWEKNTTKEFIKQCELDYEEYDMGPMYGFQWRFFNANYEGMDKSYEGKGFDQLKYVLTELKTNPNSRRILMTTYNPAQAKEGVLFPCHGISIQFNATHEKDNIYKLNISQNQRSCDYFLGVPFNIASYALLNYMICHVLNNDIDCKFKYEPGELTMFLGDHHVYEEHLKQTAIQILRIPKKFPTLTFNRNVSDITDFKMEDITIINYDCHPYIKAEMIA